MRFDGFVRKLKEEISIASERKEVKTEDMKMEMKKKGFEFSRDEIVKSDEKVSAKLSKVKITKFEETALD